MECRKRAKPILREDLPSSFVHGLLERVLRIGHKASGIDWLADKFGNAYRVREFTVLAFTGLTVAALAVAPFLTRWALLALAVVLGYRVLTMLMVHIYMLFFQLGKTTPGRMVYSRIRYLALTALNVCEVIGFGAIVFLLKKAMTPSTGTYGWERILAALVYSARSGIGFYLPNTSIPALVYGLFMCASVFTLLAVVLNILLALHPEDELVNPLHYWNWRAEYFDQSEWANEQQLANVVLRALEPIGEGDRRIVDVGCGVGLMTQALVDHGRIVLGVDSSPGMISRAAERDARMDTVTYLEGDACMLPLPRECADAVLMRMLLHNLEEEMGTALKEALRILRPGGRVIVVEGFPPDGRECEAFFKKVTSRVHRRQYFTPHELKEKLRDVGFAFLESEACIVKQCSVLKWLKGAARDEKKIEEVLDQHRSMSEVCKHAYNSQESPRGDDVFIDLRFLVMVGRKERR